MTEVTKHSAWYSVLWRYIRIVSLFFIFHYFTSICFDVTSFYLSYVEVFPSSGASLVLFISPQGWTFFYNSTRMDFSWDALQRHPIFLPSSFLSLFFPLLPFHLPFFFDFFVFFFLSPSRLSSFLPYVHLFCDMCALKLVLHMLYLVFCYFNSDSDCSVCLFRICTVIMCLH